MSLNKQLYVFSDFDGTITQQDSNDYLTDNYGMGQAMRVQLNQEIIQGKLSFRDGFAQMLNSVPLKYEETLETLKKNVAIDPDFPSFYEWCQKEGVRLVILSSGMMPFIRSLLEQYLGKEEATKIEIVSNDINVNEDGTWNIVYHDDTHFGHDKSLTIRPYAQLPEEKRPHMVYCGDGVSDLSAAKETEHLYAKKGRDLITYCKRENVSYTEFETFSEIHKALIEFKSKITV
ncbi:phosphoric monoester hydrolase Ptf1 [Schizosaccharomyces osmophilus]|uniref:Phosphoric monoester hydrolase Ptf1 n=1 Tax=Schizosaccharomyces osmophilus TaxID=2545709 RepID=A0AAE9WD50_9SCHI|nr:phosphoric monoester hydrolase Ptf1 [Schizosaccharomyces osmophilus]WBW73359.1 phosphoric monoester hydrolase Ptf1 [Schizosaccharomyces osmophilus]